MSKGKGKPKAKPKGKVKSRPKEKPRPKTPKEERLSPQQVLFLSYYLDPESETFGNALQSGLRVGFTRKYSENITHLMPKWFREHAQDIRRVAKADRNLDEILDLEVRTILRNKDGETVEGPINHHLLRIKADITKFVAERLAKERYSTRSELTGANGKTIQGITFILDDGTNSGKADSETAGSDSGTTETKS